jgi:hypothetical protein
MEETGVLGNPDLITGCYLPLNQVRYLAWFKTGRFGVTVRTISVP